MRRAFFSTVILLSLAVGATADELRVASWNIANLASRPDEPLRGHARTVEVYQQIRKIIGDLDADILALQEIGSAAAARRVLGPDYEFLFEARCYDTAEECLDDNGDIYTVIAARRSILDSVDFGQIEDLAVEHRDECGAEPRTLRGSPVAVVEFGGQTIWIASIHLKSACKEGAAAAPDLADDCATNRLQFDILSSWVASRPEGDAVILAGDFNRLLLDAPQLTGRLGDDAAVYPKEDARACWRTYRFDFDELKRAARMNNPDAYEGDRRPFVYTPRNIGAIDFFVVSGLTGSSIVSSTQKDIDASFLDFRDPSETLEHCDGTAKPFPGGAVLTFGTADPSDHCPIILSIASGEREP